MTGYSKSPVHPAQGVIEVLLTATVSLHQVEAELGRRDVVLAVGAADDLLFCTLDGQRAGLDQRGPVEQLQVAIEAARARRGKTVIRMGRLPSSPWS